MPKFDALSRYGRPNISWDKNHKRMIESLPGHVLPEKQVELQNWDGVPEAQKTKIKRPDWGDEKGDWYIPAPHEMPWTTDVAAAPPGQADTMHRLAPPPDIPPGSAYSPSRNLWRLPDGKEVDAGVFRPLPPDANTIDSQEFMMRRGYIGGRKPTIAEGA